MIPRERKWLIEKVILPIILALFGLIVAIVTIIPTFLGKKNDSAKSSTFHMQINNSNKYEQSH
jgi:hypothetical protein